jgi:hypothetical protein
VKDLSNENYKTYMKETRVHTKNGKISHVYGFEDSM